MIFHGNVDLKNEKGDDDIAEFNLQMFLAI